MNLEFGDCDRDRRRTKRSNYWPIENLTASQSIAMSRKPDLHSEELKRYRHRFVPTYLCRATDDANKARGERRSTRELAARKQFVFLPRSNSGSFRALSHTTISQMRATPMENVTLPIVASALLPFRSRSTESRFRKRSTLSE